MTRKQHQKIRICKTQGGPGGPLFVCSFCWLCAAVCGSLWLYVASVYFCVSFGFWLLWLAALGFCGFQLLASVDSWLMCLLASVTSVASGFYGFVFFFVVPYLPGEGLWILTKVQLIRVLFSSSPPLLTHFCASSPNLISRAPDSIVPSTRTSYCEVRTLWAGPGPEQREWQNRCQIECQIECRSICQKECQIEGQNKYAINTSRWYVRNYVRIVCKGGDDLK